MTDLGNQVKDDKKKHVFVVFSFSLAFKYHLV